MGRPVFHPSKEIAALDMPGRPESTFSSLSQIRNLFVSQPLVANFQVLEPYTQDDGSHTGEIRHITEGSPYIPPDLETRFRIVVADKVF
jgi:hypothetical protein